MEAVISAGLDVLILTFAWLTVVMKVDIMKKLVRTGAGFAVLLRNKKSGLKLKEVRSDEYNCGDCYFSDLLLTDCIMLECPFALKTEEKGYFIRKWS